MLLVPGWHFLTAVATVPHGTPAREWPGLAALAIEADSPFAEEQLARGYFVQPDAGALVAFAALRRKFAAVQEAWTQAAFVVPDFATWLPRAEAHDGIVILETTEAVTALEFTAASALPRRIVSRPVPTGGGDGEAALAQAREQALARLAPGARPVRRFRLGPVPCTPKGGRYQFHWETIGEDRRAPAVTTLSAAQLWAMDVREPVFLRTKRRDFQWNRYAWGALLGLGLAAVALLVAEAGLLGGRALLARRQAQLAAQEPAARLSENRSDIVNRLAGYIDRKPQPLELLAYINDLRPRSIYFTKVSVEGGLQMVVEGATSALADINEFEAALRRAPVFTAVEVKNIRAREGGGTFQLSLAFRAGFPGAPANVAAAPGPTAKPAPRNEETTPPAPARQARAAGAESPDTEPPPGPPPDNAEPPPPSS